MKVHVRTLWSEGQRPLWNTVHQKVVLQNYLNDLGFYVLTGVGDSLDVFAISYENPWDIETLMKVLDKLEKSWYKLVGAQTLKGGK